jgi:hypothetical protein
VSGDREIKKLKKDLARTREEISELQRRIQAFIAKRAGASSTNSKLDHKPKSST